jgi:hypothetical protein
VASRIENPELKDKGAAASHGCAWIMCAVHAFEEALVIGGPVDDSIYWLTSK